MEDNSPLKNWSLTPSYSPIKHFITDYVPDVTIVTEEDKIKISAPSYTNELRRSDSFPQPKLDYRDYGGIDGDYINIQSLVTNSWTDSVVFYAEKSQAAFVGDTIFKGSIGNYHFPGGNLRDLRCSITEKIFTLPDGTTLYSGHSEPTTVGAEKRRYGF